MIEQRKFVLADLLRGLEGISIDDLEVAQYGARLNHELALTVRQSNNMKTTRPTAATVASGASDMATKRASAPMQTPARIRYAKAQVFTMRAPSRAPQLRQRL